MSMPTPEQLRQWSEEVARNPASLAFIPLSDAYRRQKRLDAALRICLRGLERHPSNIEAHAVLARIYLARGDKDKAFDEWAAIQSLDEDSFEAARGLGFGHLERGEPDRALSYLTRAAELEPDDRHVREALRLARKRVEGASGTEAEAEAAAPAPVEEPPVATASPRDAGALPQDPRTLFDPLMESPALTGLVLLDADGLVLAGGMSGEGGGRADAVATVLGGTIEEAARTAEHLALGEWDGILMAMSEGVAYLRPAGEALILVSAKSGTPMGWLKRIADEARQLARSLLGGGA